ncbi:MAG TPA: hypothetical protein VLG13_03630 [Patescibacteria group bacterium]|nr:hypothetical protein [Patescibacteria group bacterium]
MRKRLNALLAVVAMLVVCCGPAWAAEQSASTGKTSGISVAPVLEQLSLVAGQDQADFTVQVTNNTPYPVQIKLGFADFKALNESGGIAFLGENATSLEQSHGLANWVRLDTQQLGLDKGATAKATVQLYNLLSLSPGGHYGAVTYQVLKAGPAGPGNRVSINQILTSLVFLTTAGGGTQRLSMPPPQLSGVQYSIPSSLNLFFKDDGNTQTTPRGSVTIDRGKGSLPIATGVVNSDSALVLPGSTRLLPTPLATLGRPWWPHEYHVHILYRTGNSTKFSTYNASFLYINPWLFAVLPVVLAMAWFVAGRLRRKPAKAVTVLRAVHSRSKGAASAIHRRNRTKNHQ